MSGRSVNLTTLLLVRLRFPEWLTSTSCTLSPVTENPLNQRKEKRKYVARRGIDRGPVTYESGPLPTALRGPAILQVPWLLIDCSRFSGPLRQYFSLYRAVSRGFGWLVVLSLTAL